MHTTGIKIKAIRQNKGMSQESLAEIAKVSLRTIQRVENNENEPRGKTLYLICEALQVNIKDILNLNKQEDKSALMYMHLSVISFILIPLGNIIIPLIFWLSKKDKILYLNRLGKNILNFQILWTIVTYSSLILFALAKIMHFNVFSVSVFEFVFVVWLFLNGVNVFVPILFSVKTNKAKKTIFYPSLIRFLK